MSLVPDSIYSQFEECLSGSLKTPEERMQALDNLVKIQSSEGNWNYSEYMYGLLNGMILAQYLMKGIAAENGPDFFKPPEQYLKDIAVTPKRALGDGTGPDVA